MKYEFQALYMYNRSSYTNYLTCTEEERTVSPVCIPDSSPLSVRTVWSSSALALRNVQLQVNQRKLAFIFNHIQLERMDASVSH